MIGTKEWKKQKGDTTPPVKNRHSDSKPSHNSCGGCNACHQMTRIHSVTGSPTWDGSDDGSQRPCATNFFQRHLGNSYMQSIAVGQSRSGGVPTIQKKCACGGSCASCAGQEGEEVRVQPKLTVGPVNDVYEQEADRVAEQVMRMPDAAVQSEHDYLTTGINIRRISDGGGGGPNTGLDIQLNQSGGRPLSTSTRRFMEPRLGVDFGHVRLHTGSDAHQTTSQVRARAFTHGNHIWLGKGASEGDKGLMAHELTHVVQQGGAVNPKRIQRRVNPSNVGCRDNPPAAIGTTDPVLELQIADADANIMLRRVLAGLATVAAQTFTTPPDEWLIIHEERIFQGMHQRFDLDPGDRAIWTGSGLGQVVFQRYRRILEILEGGGLLYTCLYRACRPNHWASSYPGWPRIYLCQPFWTDADATDDQRALTLIHEVSHIYFGTGDTGTGPYNAHCLDQFVADVNGVPIPSGFIGQCPPPP